MRVMNFDEIAFPGRAHKQSREVRYSKRTRYWQQGDNNTWGSRRKKHRRIDYSRASVPNIYGALHLANSDPLRSIKDKAVIILLRILTLLDIVSSAQGTTTAALCTTTIHCGCVRTRTCALSAVSRPDVVGDDPICTALDKSVRRQLEI
jgi:hypothetical protein